MKVYTSTLFRLSVTLILSLTTVPISTQAATLRASTLTPGTGRFEVAHGGKTIPVWYCLPEAVGPDAPVLIVMHGVNRDADRYRDEWAPHARKMGFVLLAPEFSKEAFPGEDQYNLGNMFDDQQRRRPPEDWSFSLIEPIFDAMKVATGNRSERYHLYGHSAGAQFVHRFVYFMPEARVDKAIAANAGWWTMPLDSIEFPYGLHGSGMKERDIKVALQRQLVVLLGTADIDPNHKNLRRTPEAMAQGPHRFARGGSSTAQAKASGGAGCSIRLAVFYRARCQP